MGSLFSGTRNKEHGFSQCLSEVADPLVNEGSGARVAGRQEPGQQQEFEWPWPSAPRRSADNQQTTLTKYLLTFI